MADHSMRPQCLSPSTIVVEPTNKCNIACEFCEANCTVNKHLPRIEITPEQLEQMLEKIRPYVINVVFQGDCEPTLNRHLPELARVASRYTSSVALVTNGTRLGEAYARRLIDGGVSWFALSIDDHRPEVFDRIRLRAHLTQIARHLEGLVRIRDDEHPGLHVVVHKIVFPSDTLESLREFVHTFYIRHRVNQITLAPLVEYGDVKIAHFLQLRNQLESSLIADGILINLRDIGSYPYRTLHKYCGTNLMFISHQGNLSPCTLHVRQGRDFGNLLTQSLDEIAEGERIREFDEYWRGRRYSRPIPSQCKDCFVLKSHYHRYTLNEGHERGLEFATHRELRPAALRVVVEP